MKRNIIVSTEDRTLTVSKSFYKRASVYGTDEYRELRRATDENQGFKIEIGPVGKKTYKYLTFKRMAEYIETQPDSENRMREFEAVKTVAETKGSKYPLTKQWFLATYPEYKKNEVSRAEAEKLIKEAERAAAKKPALVKNDAA